MVGGSVAVGVNVTVGVGVSVGVPVGGGAVGVRVGTGSWAEQAGSARSNNEKVKYNKYRCLFIVVWGLTNDNRKGAP